MTVKLTSLARTAEEFKGELVDLLIAKSISADTFARMQVTIKDRVAYRYEAEILRKLAHEIQAIKIIPEG